MSMLPSTGYILSFRYQNLEFSIAFDRYLKNLEFGIWYENFLGEIDTLNVGISVTVFYWVLIYKMTPVFFWI